MKIIVQPGAKSTPEAPVWVWRVFDGGREVSFGICSDEAEARELAERARRDRCRRPIPFNLDSALEGMKK